MAVGGENDEIHTLFGDEAREAAADIAPAEHERANRSLAVRQVFPESVEILVRDALVSADQALLQVEIVGVERTGLREFGDGNHVGEDQLGAMGLGEPPRKREDPLRKRRTIDGDEQAPVTSDAFLRGSRGGHQQERQLLPALQPHAPAAAAEPPWSSRGGAGR